jgi:excinuclease ABC subunit C
MKRVQSGEPGPDLILVDGGKGQLAMAEEALRTLGVTTVELASLAKSRVLDEQGHVARGKVKQRPSSDDIDRSPERVFRPGQKNPIVLRQNSNELFLLQRLRDEAHRFAITFHRKLRDKRILGSALDALTGIGPARKKALLVHFGSVDKIREATPAALAEVPGISLKLAARILTELHAAPAPS